MIDLGGKQTAEVKYGEDVYQLNIPTVRDSQKFQNEMKKAKDGSELDVFVKFLVDQGLPETVCDELTVQQLTKVAEGLTGDAKKK